MSRVTNWSLRIKLPIKGLVRKTVYHQFVGGRTLEETIQPIEKQYEYKVRTVLDYGVEAKDKEEEFDKTALEVQKIIEFANERDAVSTVAVKITGLARFALLEKISADQDLNIPEQEEWDRVIERIENIIISAANSDVSVWVDAEETWIQDAIDDLTMEFMEKYNREEPVVYNTIQLYRTGRLEYMEKCLEQARSKNFILALKLVRGAYMDKERARAEEKGYPSPIQPDKTSTNYDFERALEFCYENLDKISFVAATHNIQSTMKLMTHIDDGKIPNDHPHIQFAQLYGMSDNISYNLAAGGFRSSKLMPFGPVKDVIPYLIRRAEENTAITGEVTREVVLLRKEIYRRRRSRRS